MSKIYNLDTSRNFKLTDFSFSFSVFVYAILCCVLYAFSGNTLIDTLLLVLFVISLSNSFFKNKLKFRWQSFDKTWGGLLFFAFIMYLVLILTTNNRGFYVDYIKGGVICFLYVFLGKDYRINDKRYNALLWIYSVTAMGVAIYFVFFKIGGVIIENSSGREISKNSFGVLLCYVFIIMCFEMKYNNVFALKVLTASMCVFSFIAICVLRARTSMIVCLLVLLLLLLKLMMKDSSKFFLYASAFLFCIFIVSFLELSFIDKIIAFVNDAFTVGHENNLTSNREDRNAEAISVIKDSIFYGSIGSNVQLTWVHNYFLYVLSSWGIFVGFPLLLLYFYLWIYVLKNVFTMPFTLNTIGYFLMLVPLITSLTESTFPLYPGTTLFVAYFSLGFAINNRKK